MPVADTTKPLEIPSCEITICEQLSCCPRTSRPEIEMQALTLEEMRLAFESSLLLRPGGVALPFREVHHNQDATAAAHDHGVGSEEDGDGVEYAAGSEDD